MEKGHIILPIKPHKYSTGKLFMDKSVWIVAASIGKRIITISAMNIIEIESNHVVSPDLSAVSVLPSLSTVFARTIMHRAN